MGNCVSTRGQTVIPKQIREKFNIDETTKVEWVVSNNNILLIPIGKDLIKNSYGMLRGTGASTASLLKIRKCERILEEKKLKRLRGE